MITNYMCFKLGRLLLYKGRNKIMKAAFFDRDGTIVSDYPDEMWRYISQPEFIVNAFIAMKHVINLGYDIRPLPKLTPQLKINKSAN